MTENEEQPGSEAEASLPISEENRQREPSQYETAMMIADRLGEKDRGVRTQLTRIVRELGRTQARALLAETLRIEEEGGMLLPDGARRRTPGGVFFHLVYTTGQTKSGVPLERSPHAKRQRATPHNTEPASVLPQQPSIPALPMQWAERFAALEEIGTGKGRATNVKITLIGQLGSYAEKGACIVATMQTEKLPALPKGLPPLQTTPTTYVVYIAAKQWKSVASVASDAEDVFIIEGFPQLDTETGSIAVFAMNVTSKKLQAAKKQSREEGGKNQ